MRVLDLAVPLLAGFASLAEAQGLNFTQVYAVKPSLKTSKHITSSSTKIATASIASSIVSVLSAQHAATMVKSSSATTSLVKSSSTSVKISSSSSSTTKTSSTSTKSASTSASHSTTLSTKASTTSSSSPKISSSSSTGKASTSKKAKRAVTTASPSTTSSSTTASSATTCTNVNNILYGYTPTPNTPAQFLLDNTLSTLAAAAWLPPAGYSTSFQNAYGGLFANGYIGYYQLASYNTSACAAICDGVDACNAFNIYFERAPIYVPDASCPNPNGAASVTCALWGSSVNASQATNIGQYKKDFMVVIQGSNGYNQNTPPPSVNNYAGPTALDGGINVAYIGSTYVFLKAYTFANYDVTQCSSQCNALSATNKQYATSFGYSSYTPCNYFNTFNITLGGQVQAMYCQLYSTSAVASYDSLTTSTDAFGNTYNFTYSYGYALNPQDPGSTSYTWTAAPSGANATCSGLGTAGSTYVDNNAVTYTLGCGYDVQYSNDIGNATAPNFYSCFNLCDKFSGCSGFAYLGTTCYFKNLAGSSRTPQLNNYNVDMAWQPAAYAGFSASTIATTITFTTSTTAWAGASTTTATQIISGSGTVLVQTPGAAAATGTVYVTTGVDSGTATTISSTTITPGAGSNTGTVKYFYPTPVTTCGNAGITWAGYSNLFAGYQSTSSYPMYKPESFKKAAPTWSGTASYLAETNAIGATATVYGQKYTYNQLQTLTLNHVFYVFAGRGTGYYSLTIPQTDDATFVWQGPNALSGYTRANANLISTSLVHQSVTIAFFLTANTYTPFRVQWGNGAGAGDLEFNLNAPDGSVMLASNGNAGTMSPDIVFFACNTTLAAKPTAFGKET